MLLKTDENNKKFLWGVQGGGFYEKSPLAAGGIIKSKAGSSFVSQSGKGW
jgi:hypothetical protein